MREQCFFVMRQQCLQFQFYICQSVFGRSLRPRVHFIKLNNHFRHFLLHFLVIKMHLNNIYGNINTNFQLLQMPKLFYEIGNWQQRCLAFMKLTPGKTSTYQLIVLQNLFIQFQTTSTLFVIFTSYTKGSPKLEMNRT